MVRGGRAVAERLALNNVRSCEVPAAAGVLVEGYTVQRVGVATQAGRESINPDQSMRVTVRSETIDLPAGTLFVPMAQTASGIVSAALEPDSPGSYLAVGVIPLEVNATKPPVYRVMANAPASLGCP